MHNAFINLWLSIICLSAGLALLISDRIHNTKRYTVQTIIAVSSGAIFALLAIIA
jgi:predicted Na+-dependent transporter